MIMIFFPFLRTSKEVILLEKCFPAHIRYDGEKHVVQTVQEHCRNTADYASNSLNTVGLYNCAYLAGLLHDMGKFTEEFKHYLESAVLDSKPSARGSVNHTFAGVRFMLENYHSISHTANNGVISDLCAELIAYAVGAHHGLFDCMDEKLRSGFDHRMTSDIAYDEARENFLAFCSGRHELDKLFLNASSELESVIRKIDELQDRDSTGAEGWFYFGLLSRLILSSVIEGDRRDTAEFMSMRQPLKQKTDEERRKMWAGALEHMEHRLSSFKHDTPIQFSRQRISQICVNFAEKPSGVYQLNVPTGSGKTLSSLRFALAHAARWNKSRIIFTSPLLTILEQNAKVIRSFVGDDSIILEHHSNVIRNTDRAEILDQMALLEDSWQSPIIITTLVQLLNTLFSGKTSCIRRFQSLCDSIIIIDEVQTVPSKMLTLFNLAVNFLSDICGATVVLCSATQPCLNAAAHPLIAEPKDMVPFDAGLWAPFRRTEYVCVGEMALDDIPSFAAKLFDGTESLLIICNRKSEAEFIYNSLKLYDADCFHLSAGMCVAHRRQTLEQIYRALKQNAVTGRKTVCVSTQVIEAGVDISFGRVIRLCAGMDSIVQAAGRCNRNGENKSLSQVYIVQCSNENLSKLPDIQRGKDASISLLDRYRSAPDQFGCDLASKASINYYYSTLYRLMPDGFQDYTVKTGCSTNTIFSLLSLNAIFANHDNVFLLRQSFKLAGERFEVFENETADVLVPYGDGKNIIAELSRLDPDHDLKLIDDWLAKAKAYTVSLYSWQKNKLELSGGLASICGSRILVLQEGFYDQATGFTETSQANTLLEV